MVRTGWVWPLSKHIAEDWDIWGSRRWLGSMDRRLSFVIAACGQVVMLCAMLCVVRGSNLIFPMQEVGKLVAIIGDEVSDTCLPC